MYVCMCVCGWVVCVWEGVGGGTGEGGKKCIPCSSSAM